PSRGAGGATDLVIEARSGSRAGKVTPVVSGGAVACREPCLQVRTMDWKVNELIVPRTVRGQFHLPVVAHLSVGDDPQRAAAERTTDPPRRRELRDDSLQRDDLDRRGRLPGNNVRARMALTCVDERPVLVRGHEDGLD